MKKLLYIGLAAAAGLAFFACSKDTVKGTDTPEEPTVKLVTITASIPEEGLATKVSFAEDETTLRLTKLSWETGDVLDIAGKTFTIVDASISTDGKTASFTGVEPAAASSYTVTYNSIASKGIDLNAQEQTSNGSTDHLGYSIVVEATDYKTVSFENATSQSSVLQLRAKLPDGIKNAVKKVIFKSNLAVFNGEKQLTVALGDGTTGSDNLLNVYATLPTGAQTLSEKMELLIQFQVVADKEYEKYTAYREFPAGTAFIKEGSAQYIGIDCTNIVSYANKTNTQIGSVDNPYLIGDAYQLQALNAFMASKSAGTTVYAELVDDIDLQVYSNWSPIDASTRYIHLDGRNNEVKNMTITSGTYCGLFGVLYGTVKNLTITDASVKGVTKASGILTGYICSNSGLSEGCTIDNVVINRASLNGGSQYCGAIAGLIGKHVSNTFAVKISNVEITGLSVTSSQTCGGLLGYTQSGSSVNRSLTIANVDIFDSSVVTTGEGKCVGGLIGIVDDANATISGISVKGTNVSGLTKADAVGGIIGQVTAAADFDNCTYEKSDTKTATVTGPTQHDGTDNTVPTGGYVGGIAGEVSGNASFDDCHVKNATITFTNPSENTGYWKYTGGAFGYLHASGAKIGDTAACSVETVSVTAYHYCGGFVAFMDGGSIKQSTVSALTISGQNYVGGFVGQLNTGSVTGCSVSGNAMKANATVAGFVGRCDGGTLEGNTTSLPLGTTATKVGTNVGGFVGFIEGSPSFSNCNASGDIYASGGGVGGFAGTVNTGAPTFSNNCYATGSVSSSGNSIGGFVGNDAAGGKYMSCYSSGTVSGKQSVGGFIGKAKAATFEGCSYKGTAVAGAITSGNAMVGGFCGHTETTACSFTSCYVYNATSGTKVEGATQRVGGFIGQLALPGDNISKCYVKNVSISGKGNNYGGFGGVFYGKASECYVEESIVTANGNNVAGFAGYPENATITNSYVASDVTVNGGTYNNIGGFAGIMKGGTTITQCYEAATVSGTGTGIGSFIGYIDTAPTSVTKCIAWNGTLAFYGGIKSGESDSAITGNYTGNTGTVSSQAASLGWDSTIWDCNSSDFPTLIGVN